jgi:hypothetical protein
MSSERPGSSTTPSIHRLAALVACTHLIQIMSPWIGREGSALVTEEAASTKEKRNAGSKDRRRAAKRARAGGDSEAGHERQTTVVREWAATRMGMQ